MTGRSARGRRRTTAAGAARRVADKAAGADRMSEAAA